jgi:hypothetical protein
VSTTVTERWQSPPEIGRTLKVCPERIIKWIRSGALAAVNVADGHQRPRFRVSPEALAQFLASRSTTPVPKAVRRKKPSVTRQFY